MMARLVTIFLFGSLVSNLGLRVLPTPTRKLFIRFGLAAALLATSSATSHDELNKLTVPKLKEKLRELGLPVGGLKAELVERLVASSAGASVLEQEVTVSGEQGKQQQTTVPKTARAAPSPPQKIVDLEEVFDHRELDELEELMMEGERVLSHSSAASTSSSRGPAASQDTRRIDTTDGKAASAKLPAIEQLLIARGEARMSRDFDKADDIRDQLKSQFGVELYDRDGRWRADSGETGFYPSIQKAPKPRDVITIASKAELQDLVDQRTRARRARNFALADDLRAKLSDNGVELFDAMNTWSTMDGKYEGQQSVDTYGGRGQGPRTVRRDDEENDNLFG